MLTALALTFGAGAGPAMAGDVAPAEPSTLDAPTTPGDDPGHTPTPNDGSEVPAEVESSETGELPGDPEPDADTDAGTEGLETDAPDASPRRGR